MTADLHSSPFLGSRQCPLYFEEPQILSRLPNYGVYCIMYSSLRPKDHKRPAEEHFAARTSDPVRNMQIEYMWNSAIPRRWKVLTARPFLSIKGKKRDTLEFLKETQKYIHTIRKPLVLDEDELALPGWEEKQNTVRFLMDTKGEAWKPARRPNSLSLYDLHATTIPTLETEPKPISKTRQFSRLSGDFLQSRKTRITVLAKVNTWRKPRLRRKKAISFTQYMQDTHSNELC